MRAYLRDRCEISSDPVDIYIYNYVCGTCMWGGRQPVRGSFSKREFCSSGEDFINSAILLFDFNFRILLS